jgi:uncharacterized protein
MLNPPIIKGFKPYGRDAGKQLPEPVNLLFEEYEALRLSDYDGMNHLEASLLMDVSRPTFTRIYASALKKIARAFVEGRPLVIEGGKVYFDSDWYHCMDCRCYFNNPEKERAVDHCPLCGHNKIARYEKDDPHLESQPEKDFCYCPQCGLELEHEKGRPCSNQSCPHCGHRMKRKGSPPCGK